MKNLSQKLINYSYITLSGEINIISIDYRKPIINEIQIIDNIREYSKTLQNIYPKFIIKVETGMSEATLSIFTYKSTNMRAHFLDELKINLEGLLNQIYNLNDVEVNLKMSGYIDSYRGRYSYIYLNSKREVAYKITSFTTNSNFISKMKFIIKRTSE